jgi:GDPmannose 4,6-dehydratase
LTKAAEQYDEVIILNAAAQSHVHTSFEQPKYTFDVNFGGILNILEVMKENPSKYRLVQCSTSEMYGDNYDMEFDKDGNEVKFQDEYTKFSPMSPYAVSKVAAHQLINNYRKAYGLHASCAIMFNYESFMRGDEFLTQKVCTYVKYIQGCKMLRVNPSYKLQLGNLNSYRDFTFAGDTAHGVILMAMAERADDYVICSSNSIKIESFVDLAFKSIGENYKHFVEINQSLIRPSEVDYLNGRANKIIGALGWSRTMDINSIIKHMVQHARPPV